MASRGLPWEGEAGSMLRRINGSRVQTAAASQEIHQASPIGPSVGLRPKVRHFFAAAGENSSTSDASTSGAVAPVLAARSKRGRFRSCRASEGLEPAGCETALVALELVLASKLTSETPGVPGMLQPAMPGVPVTA